MICKLCGADRKLIKAHVIPAAFFEKNGNDSAFESFLYTFDLTTHSKRLPAGIYDKELLCNDCAPMATSNSSTCGHPKILHLTRS